MRLTKLQSKNYPEDPTRFFKFERYFKKNANDKNVLIPFLVDFSKLNSDQKEKYIYLEFEEPNRFFSDNPLFNHSEYEDLFDKVLTICPFTASWLNGKFENSKRTSVFFPFNEDYTPGILPKKYDVIYTGNLVSETLVKLVESISKYNYRLVSGSDHDLVTDRDASYTKKLELIASSKVTIVTNLLYLSKEHVQNVHKVKGWRNNKAYSCLPRNRISLWYKKGEIIAPQLKSRVFEAAFSRSLILCRKDPFNIIEQFFEPEKEFIYYEPDRLEETLQDILNNYADYADVVERAYTKAAGNYTTSDFYNKYLKAYDD